MSKIHKQKLLIGVAIPLALAILLPTIFGEPRIIADQTGGDSWRNFIYDFQTLITGVLAIAAAYFTINSSQRIDKEADRRHVELVGLTLRADRLRVERLLHPALNTLLSHYWEIESVKLPLLKQMITEREPKAVRVVLEEMDVAIWTVKRVLLSSPFPETKDLFDGPLNYQYDLMEKLADLVRRSISETISLCDIFHSGLKREQTDKIAVAESEAIRLLDALERYKRDYVENYGDFLESLEEMKREYKMS